jgi:hypothetical protein
MWIMGEDVEAISLSSSFSDTAMSPRHQTRVLLVFGLTNRLADAVGASRPLHTLMAFGRFEPHIEDAAWLLPRVLLEERFPGQPLALADAAEPLALADLTLLVGVTPRCDLILVVDGVLADGATSDEITKLLYTTCVHRWRMTLDDEPILECVRGRIEASGQPVPEDLRFGRHVHQMVFAGGALLGQVLGDESSAEVLPVVSDLVYRGAVGAPLAIHRPLPLNHPGRLMVAHGRGVSVVAGWAVHMENMLALMAVNLTSALGVLQRARHNAFGALSLHEDSAPESITEARTIVGQLAADLNDVQLDLSFGVEAYTDTLLIPEQLPEAFQCSLRDAAGLNDGLRNTSQMLERLQSVIQTRLSALDTAVKEQQERRSRAFSGMIAAGTLIALPPTLLLAFFGANSLEVDENRSVLDLSHYWIAYLLAWLPFTALVLVGFATMRRTTTSFRQIPAHAMPSRAASEAEEHRVVATTSRGLPRVQQRDDGQDGQGRNHTRQAKRRKPERPPLGTTGQRNP